MIASFNILEAVSYSLLESQVLFTVPSAISPGVQTVTPPSMVAIYPGAELVAGPLPPGSANQEVITVSSVTATTFTATFALSHPSTDSIFGATFPSGQPDHVLFTQSEMLRYLAQAQKDFLLKTQCVVSVGTVPITVGNRFYTQPNQAIRIERISINGYELENCSQRYLDIMKPFWMAETQSWGQNLKQWFQDETNNLQFGVYPLPQTGQTAEVWYSDRGADNLALDDLLTVPDIFWPTMKYHILFRAFSKDGEQRDTARAKACNEIYKLFVWVGTKFMRGVEAAIEQKGRSQKQMVGAV